MEREETENVGVGRESREQVVGGGGGSRESGGGGGRGEGGGGTRWLVLTRESWRCTAARRRPAGT